MREADLLAGYPRLYHMAEAGSWPSISSRGLLSTRALVDLYDPPPPVHDAILGRIRGSFITLDDPTRGHVVIRDQAPLKFLDRCLTDGTSVQQFLDALNGRVFFWVSLERLRKLLGARKYRSREHVVLQIETADLLDRYRDMVQLAPYNTGSVHVPNSPRRGPEVFVDVEAYPFDEWRTKRRRRGDPLVELTVPYAVPDIAELVSRVDVWRGGERVAELFER